MKDYKVDKASLSASFCQEVYQVVREIPVGKVSPGWTEQKQLLLEEGISFKQNGCVDLKKHLWNYSVSEWNLHI